MYRFSSTQLVTSRQLTRHNTHCGSYLGFCLTIGFERRPSSGGHDTIVSILFLSHKFFPRIKLTSLCRPPSSSNGYGNRIGNDHHLLRLELQQYRIQLVGKHSGLEHGRYQFSALAKGALRGAFRKGTWRVFVIRACWKASWQRVVVLPISWYLSISTSQQLKLKKRGGYPIV